MAENFENVRSDLYTAILNEFDPDDLKIIFDNHINSNPQIKGNHAYKFVSNTSRDWKVQCSDVLTYAYQNSLVPHLIAELQNARPNTAITSKILLEGEVGVFDKSDQSFALQKYIRDSNFQDPYVFVSNILRATRRTCLIIGKQGKLGTGFLVSDDQILTNFHVYKKALDSGEQLSSIRAVFGYATSSDGRTVNPGFEIGIADDFIPITSQVSAGDRFDEEPKNLDYALLNLSDAVGKEKISQTLGVSETRDYFGMTSTEALLKADEDVFVFHHPKGGPVKCSPGQFEAYEDDSVRSRVRYDAPTLYGSSGGAVLDSNFELIALHHAGDNNKPPKFNQGIPIHLIKNDIDRQLAERTNS